MSEPAKRFGVAGWPVAHSRSPAMHEAAYAALGLDGWHYQKLPIPPEAFEETVLALPAAGFAGINVTIPHKEAALALATEATDAARSIGAANTLTFGPGGEIHADNTDAPGFLASLPDSPEGRGALVLGAGGSARAIVWALSEAGAARVEIWNRTPERARELAADFGATAVARPPEEPRWLVVNCTSVGLGDPHATPIDEFEGVTIAVDLVYREGGTEFVRRAREAGATAVDGLEILVRQGALSFERWSGRPAPLGAMRRGAGAQH